MNDIEKERNRIKQIDAIVGNLKDQLLVYAAKYTNPITAEELIQRAMSAGVFKGMPAILNNTPFTADMTLDINKLIRTTIQDIQHDDPQLGNQGEAPMNNLPGPLRTAGGSQRHDSSEAKRIRDLNGMRTEQNKHLIDAAIREGTAAGTVALEIINEGLHLTEDERAEREANAIIGHVNELSASQTQDHADELSIRCTWSIYE